MRSIWVRAGVGALLVFALGMMLYSAARAGKARATVALDHLKEDVGSSVVAAAAQMSSMPFSLDGRKIGRLTSLTLDPGSGSSAPTLAALVTLDRDQLDAAVLASCNLVPVRPDRLESSQGFRCATPGERGLTRLGEVRFEPAGVVRPVLVDDAAMAELRRAGRITIDSSPRGAMRANVTGDSGEIVNISADSNGAFIHVNDGKGKVVRLSADRHGVVVKVDTSATH
jgi:hypothetical protein